MNHPDTNENSEKLSLLKQIHKYRDEGYTVDKYYSIGDDINELKYIVAVLHEKKRKTYIESELKFYKFYFGIICKMTGKPMPSQEELLKYCYGSDEYYEHNKSTKT